MSMNIWGLGSGLDTGMMIEQLMQLERLPYTKLQQKKQDFTSFQSYFRSLNTKLSTLKDRANELTLNANFQLTSTKSSDEQTVKVSGSDKAVTGTFNVKVENLAKSHVIKTTEFDANEKSTLSGEFTVFFKDPKADGGQSKVTIDLEEVKDKSNGDVLEYVKNEINRKTKAVSASVVETTPGKKTLVLTSSNTGTKNSFHIIDGEKLSDDQGVGLSKDLAELFTKGNDFNTVQSAEDAKLTVNGLEVTSSSNQVKGVIDGVTLTLLKENSSAMVTVGQDSDKVVEKVKEFVNVFNDVRKLIRDNSGKGKPLQGDSTLRQLDMELTNWVSNNIPGIGNLVDIGIEMDKGKTKGEEMTGQLSFDEKKFKEKLEQNPDMVISLFNVDKTEGTSKMKGIATAMNEELRIWTSSANGLIQSRIKGYDADISYVSDSMSSMENRLAMKEKQLKKQFAAMEVALGQLKNQQSWLNGQIAALSKKD